MLAVMAELPVRRAPVVAVVRVSRVMAVTVDRAVLAAQARIAQHPTIRRE